MPGLTPDVARKIHELIHNKQILMAIQLYRDATGVGLAEAKKAVEEMAQIESTKPPSDVRDFDNPVLEGRIKSLLAKGKKIDAVKIYREEYGVGLKEAKDAVERMESSMRPDPASMSYPYESAIGSDPFTDDEATYGRRVVFAAAVVVAIVCGLAAFLLMMNF